MESSLSTQGPSSGVPATADDFLIEYRAISNKLKKSAPNYQLKHGMNELNHILSNFRRFLRRPNVAEANEQFSKLYAQGEIFPENHCWD